MPRRIIFAGVPSYAEVAAWVPDVPREDSDVGAATAARDVVPETEASLSEGPGVKVIKDSFEAPTDSSEAQAAPQCDNPPQSVTANLGTGTRTTKVPLRPPHEPARTPAPTSTLMPPSSGSLSYLSWRRVAPDGNEAVERRNSFMDHVHIPKTPVSSLRGLGGSHNVDHEEGVETPEISFLTVTPGFSERGDANDHTDIATESEGEEDELNKSFALHALEADATVTPLKTDATRRSLRKRRPSTSSEPETSTKRRKKSENLQNVRTVRLRELPSAGQLAAWASQPVSVNLVVALITKKPERTITTRRGVDVGLVELLVGDETRASFSVTFWLGQSRDSRRAKEDRDEEVALRATLDGLKAGDVLLLRSIALRTFRGDVQGQSLGRGLHRTTLALLWRRGLKASSLERATGEEAPVYDSDTLARSSLTTAASKAREARGKGKVEAEALPARAHAVRAWVAKIVAPASAAPPSDIPRQDGAADIPPSASRRAQRAAWRAEELPADDTPGRVVQSVSARTRRAMRRERP